MFKFKEETPVDKRREEVAKIISKWPGRIPIILEKSKNSQLEDIPKSKFLCPSDYTVQQFLGCIRKKVKMRRDTALFIFVNGRELVTGDASMQAIYEQKKDEDGFLYMIYSDQDVMGVGISVVELKSVNLFQNFSQSSLVSTTDDHSQVDQ